MVVILVLCKHHIAKGILYKKISRLNSKNKNKLILQLSLWNRPLTDTVKLNYHP